MDYSGRVALYMIEDEMCASIVSSSINETDIDVRESCIGSNFTKVFVGRLNYLTYSNPYEMHHSRVLTISQMFN